MDFEALKDFKNTEITGSSGFGTLYRLDVKEFVTPLEKHGFEITVYDGHIIINHRACVVIKWEYRGTFTGTVVIKDTRIY